MQKKIFAFLFLSFLTIAYSFGQLSRPTLSSPSNNSSMNSVYFNLQWTTVSAATSYICQIDTLMTFSSPALVNDTLYPGDFNSNYSYSYKAYYHYYGKKHYWRVRAFNENDLSPWSLVSNYTTYATCNLSNPANGATDVTLSRQLSWSSINGTTTYRLQIDTAPTFSSPMLMDLFTSSTSFTQDFLFNTTYYWHVQCFSMKDTSDWSSVWSFSTVSDSLALQSPYDNATNQPVTLTAYCSSISGISYYDFEWDTVPSFDSQKDTIAHRTSTSVSLTPLYYGQDYYWRARAVANIDTGAWTPYRAFKTQDTVILSSPSNGYNIGNNLITSIRWNAITGTTRYKYQCDTTPFFNSPRLKEGTTTGTSATVSALLYGVTYYWRVCAYNSVDTSSWQTPWTFITNAYPALSYPSDGESITGTAQTSFSWASFANSSYQWQLDTTPTFDSPRMEMENLSGTYNYSYTYNYLPFDCAVYWRVRCYSDYGDTSAWSPARVLYTSSSSLYSPADSTVLNNTLKQQVRWTQYYQSSYEYMWDTTPNFDSPYRTTGVNTDTYSTSTTLTLCRYGETCYWTMRNFHARDTSSWKAPRRLITPAALTLTSPADGDSLTTMYGALRCTAITGTSKYEYQCDTVSSFDSPYLLDKISTSYNYQMEPLIIGQKHFWRVRAISTCDTSDWSEIRSFVTANNFTLISPTDSTVFTSTFNPTLQWTALYGCTGYIYQIDTTPNFDSHYFVEGTRTSSYNTVSTPTLRYDREYFWRVRAINAIDTTPWTVTWRFYTPKGPQCSSPLDSAVLTTLRPYLQWTSAYARTKYEYQCDTTPTFDSPYLVNGSTTYTYATCTTLHYDKLYYWRVRAIKSTDTSEWCSPWRFITPAGPAPSSPADSISFNCGDSPQLRCNSISYNTSYIFQYDTVPTFDSPSSMTMSSSNYYINLSALVFGQQYYWRVRGATAVDTSQWSAVRTFTAPQGITLTDPYDSTVVTSLCDRYFYWNGCSGFMSQYEFEIDTVTTFDSPMADNYRTWTTNTYAYYGYNFKFKKYYWRVRGVNLDGTDTTAWTPYFTYIIRDSVPLSSPADNSFITHVNNQQLYWNSYSCANTYEYQCDTTMAFNSAYLKRGTTSSYYRSVNVPYYGTRYYWRVRVVSPDTSAWSAVWSFITLDSTTLSTTDSLVMSSPCNTFYCNSMSGTSQYRFQFDTIATFNSPNLVDTVMNTYYANITFRYNTRYYWRVQMMNSVDTSHWSLVRTFTTPDTMRLRTPADYTVLTTLHPSLRCYNDMGCASDFIWRIDTSANFDSPLYQIGSGNNVSMNNLHYGVTYNWQMAAVNISPDTSSWSMSWHFTTPDMPTLSSPADGYVSPGPCISFSWTAVTGSVGYEYEADTATTFDSPLLIHKSWATSTTSFTNYELHYGQTYYWRVRAFNEVDTSSWSLYRYFTTPDTIMMYSPVDGTALTTLSTNLCWNTMNCSDSYQVQLDTTSAFNSNVLVDDNSNSCYYTNQLLYGKTYYWHVRPFTSYDTAYWQTQPWTFTTAANVVLTQPLDSSVLSDISTVLRWEGIGGSTHYIYEYDTVPTFNSPALQTGIRPDGYLYMSLYDLPFNTTYYWHVRAYNDIDTSAWSSTWMFSTPAGVTLVSPADNAVNACQSLQWSNMASIPYYDYKLDTTSAFNSPELRTGTLVNAYSINLNSPSLRYGTTYYWTVMAYSPEDSSAWAAPHSFTTVGAPALSSPSNGSNLYGTGIYLYWSSVCLNTTKYEYCVATDSNFLSIVYQNTTSSTSIYNSYAYGMTYYWKVRAINDVDTSDWSTPWMFYTDCYYYNASLYTPNNNATNIPTVGQNFQWTSYNYYDYWEFEYSLNSSFEPCTSINVYGTSTILLDTLMGNTTYYWRVRGAMNPGYSCWSNVYRFTTTTNYLAGPALTVDTCGSSYAWHGHTYTANGTYLDTISGWNTDTIYSLQLTLHQPYNIETSQDACDSYPWQGQTYSSSGTYTRSYQSIYGCDSTLVLHLTIYNTPDAVIEYDSITHTLTCLTQNVTYQWLDCNDNYAQILGATSATFVPEANGSYAVLVKAGGICSDISDCIDVDLTSGVSSVEARQISCYPNPVTMNLQVEGLAGNETLMVYDVVGKMVAKWKAKNQVEELDFGTFENGIYFLEIKNADYSIVKKIVKE